MQSMFDFTGFINHCSGWRHCSLGVVNFDTDFTDPLLVVKFWSGNNLDPIITCKNEKLNSICSNDHINNSINYISDSLFVFINFDNLCKEIGAYIIREP